MPVTKKTTSKKTTTKKVVKKVAKKTVPVVEPTPVVEATPVVEPTPVVETAATPVVEVDHALTDSFSVVADTLTSMVRTLRDVTTALKRLRTTVKRRVDTAERVAKNAVRSANKGRRSNNNVPLNLDDELASFLGVEAGSKMTMKQVRAGMMHYFKAHQLHSTENHSHLNLDETLTTLFTPSEGDVVTTRNYYKFVAPHLTA